ncbi:hypothetical protein HAX54_034357 [Datura stramonium]|uniref:Uncharacterized protein n=1 Tax=Datura stramonium TaxID=4076 RepID=A0ABS8VDU6_DATST|nr:hypothetical protein [Datura stramonium]
MGLCLLGLCASRCFTASYNRRRTPTPTQVGAYGYSEWTLIPNANMIVDIGEVILKEFHQKLSFCSYGPLLLEGKIGFPYSISSKGEHDVAGYCGDPRSADEPLSLSRKLSRDILHWCYTGESLLLNREVPMKYGFVAVACNLATRPAFQPAVH